MSAVLRKVGLTLVVQQQRPTNFCFLRENDYPTPMKPIAIHVYILSGVANSHLLLLSEEGILSLRSNELGKRGC